MLTAFLIFIATLVVPAPAPGQSPVSADRAIDRMIEGEAALTRTMEGFHPLVETYIQSLDRDRDLTFVPTGDRYFFGKFDFQKDINGRSLLKNASKSRSFGSAMAELYSIQYMPNGFAQMFFVGGHFDRAHYNFEYIRREFLGETRCLVFDVTPKPRTGASFTGRIWAEDQDYNVVRFNGTFGPSSPRKVYFHFDSWRENSGPGLWLPAYVYTEESDMQYMYGMRKLRFKGLTRLWGYNAGRHNPQNELSTLVVESDEVRDRVDQSENVSPVQALRDWERQAEDNVIERMEKAALLAPDGEVNKVLETVLTNLQITNTLDIQPEIRARILLTTPIESFTIGHTVVLSRGLIDVLPDEASLAMVLAHELAHIALGHRIDTKYAFGDRMIFEDPEAFRRVQLKRDDTEEAEADAKAVEYLKKSPYKDKLGNAGLFLRALDERAGKLSHLLLPHVGNSMVKGSQVRRMADLLPSAPKLETPKISQVAALPLGGRVRVDPWSAKIELIKSDPVTLLSAREKMPFEITPVFLRLTRQSAAREITAAEGSH